jgi:hypothetical protein
MESPKPRSLERLIGILALALPAVILTLQFSGLVHWGRLAAVYAVALFVLCYSLNLFIGNECKHTENISDEHLRLTHERAIVRKVAVIVLALLVSLPAGYFIGRLF